MKLNCKPGDLAAVVVSPSGKNLGKIVRCLEFIPSGTKYKRRVGDLGEGTVNIADDSWHVDIPIWRRLTARNYSYQEPICCDATLRPIRDQPGEDETLTWAGKPETLKVKG